MSVAFVTKHAMTETKVIRRNVTKLSMHERGCNAMYERGLCNEARHDRNQSNKAKCNKAFYA